MSNQTLKIKETTPETYFVQSGTDERVGYTVNIKEGTCECPQNFHRGLYCKHQEVVDEHLIITERILIDECKNNESNKSLGCAFQQTMLDRGYICLPEYVWKKKEAYDAMPDEKKLKIIIDKVDKNNHFGCSEFHLFKQEKPGMTDDEAKTYALEYLRDFGLTNATQQEKDQVNRLIKESIS